MKASRVALRAARRAALLVPRPLRPRLAGALASVGLPRWLLPEWEYAPEGFGGARTDPYLKGWEGSTVGESYRSKLPELLDALSGTAPLAVTTSAVLPTRRSMRDHNTVMTFGYVLGLVAGGRDRLSVLDWGGGIGLHRHLAGALFPGLELDYHVKELAQVCAVGRELVPEVTFHEDRTCLERRYDLVMASSSLQYEERWRDTTAQLAGAAGGHLFLTRVPVVFRAPSYVLRQRAYGYGLDTEYLGWVVNRDELVACATGAGTELVREFLIGLDSEVTGVPEQQETRAFLFRRSAP